MIGSKKAWTARNEPMAMPSGMPIAAAMRKPSPTRRKLAHTSAAKSSWANIS